VAGLRVALVEQEIAKAEVDRDPGDAFERMGRV